MTSVFLLKGTLEEIDSPLIMNHWLGANTKKKVTYTIKAKPRFTLSKSCLLRLLNELVLLLY